MHCFLKPMSIYLLQPLIPFFFLHVKNMKIHFGRMILYFSKKCFDFLQILLRIR